MTSDVRFERLVQELLAETAPAAAPDELVPAVLAATRQTRRWPAWLARTIERPLRINERVVVGSPALRAGYAASVAVVAFVIGLGGVIGAASFLSERGAPGTTPTATVTTSATPELTANLPIRIDSDLFQPSFTFQVPRGWLEADEGTDYYRLASPEAGSIVLQANPIIGTDENLCEGLAAADGATTAEGIVASLSSDPRLTTSSPRPVAVGDLIGQSIDVGLDPAWTGTCSWSAGNPAALLLTSQDGPGPMFGIQQSEPARIIVVDVGNDVVSIILDSQDSSQLETLTTEAMPIIEGIQFTL